MRAAPSPRAARAREDLADVRRPRDEVARRRNSSHSGLEPIVGTLQTCAWSEWHPRIWRYCSYCIIWASSMQKVHSAGIQCALFYYPLSSRFSSFACSRGGSPSRAHTATRAPRPRPTSPPAFPSARYPRFPPRARTPRPAVSQRSPAMSYDDEFDEPPPSRRGDLRVPHFVSRSETDYFNEVELMSEECASRSRDPRDPRSPSGPERTAPRATRPRRGTRGGKP